MILDGIKLSAEIYKELSIDIKNCSTQPRLGAILVGDDPASLRYIRQKKKFSEKLGIEFELFQFSENITENELIEKIHALNDDSSISGYIVQLPLPKHIDTLRVIRHINPLKDVDGFHPENQGKVVMGDPSGLSPCTPAGVMYILDHYNISLSGKHVCVLGQSNIVGKPMALMCINAGATVSSCNHLTDDISFYTKKADIIISATGHIHLITPENVKEDAIIVDVGFCVKNGNIYGDADTQALINAGHTITPVPGGVGPMTVAMLLSNTYKAHMHERI